MASRRLDIRPAARRKQMVIVARAIRPLMLAISCIMQQHFGLRNKTPVCLAADAPTRTLLKLAARRCISAAAVEAVDGSCMAVSAANTGK